jgi:hypothetical protein
VSNDGALHFPLVIGDATFLLTFVPSVDTFEGTAREICAVVPIQGATPEQCADAVVENLSQQLARAQAAEQQRLQQQQQQQQQQQHQPQQ